MVNLMSKLFRYLFLLSNCLILFLTWSPLGLSAETNSTISVPIAATANANANGNQVITQLINSVVSLPMSEKINKASAFFLGRPYQFEPNGEGAQGLFNQEPLYRTDIFDCQTYVSTVLAIVLSHNLSEFQKNIRLVDYKQGQVSFMTRNHFGDADWLQNNMKNGFLKNISADIAGNNSVATASAVIDRENWYRDLSITRIHIDGLSQQQRVQKLNDLHAESKLVHNSVGTIIYIPLHKLLMVDGSPSAILNNIPSGSIVLLIRPNIDLTSKIGTHINVMHMGFAIRENNYLYFRAASSSHHRVVDILLVDYLRAFQKASNNGGISVMEVRGGVV